jgi:CRP-like cAMP-binding protein
MSLSENSNKFNDAIFKNISKHITLDEAELRHFTSVLTYKTVSKKTYLLKEGQHCNAINYVVSGALRAFCLDKEGKEATIMFAVSDWWVTDMYCFVQQKTAMMYIEAIEDSVICSVRKEDLDELYVKIPKFERFFRILMQNAYTREQLRIIENLSLTAEKRYDSFLEKYPHIAQQVTQKQIASYLGITPEFLSAIRKNKSQSKIS